MAAFSQRDGAGEPGPTLFLNQIQHRRGDGPAEATSSLTSSDIQPAKGVLQVLLEIHLGA